MLSIFYGSLTPEQRLSQRKAILKFEKKFDGEKGGFFTFMDDLKDHVEDTGVSGNFTIGVNHANTMKKIDRNLFSEFGQIPESAIIQDLRDLENLLPSDPSATLPRQQKMALHRYQ